MPTAEEIGPDRRRWRLGARAAIPALAALLLLGVLVAVNRDDGGATRLAVERPADNPVTVQEPEPVTTTTTVETTVPPVTTPPTTVSPTTLPPAPQPLHLEDSDGRLRVTADIDNIRPLAGQVVRVDLKISYVGVIGTDVDFGDGIRSVGRAPIDLVCSLPAPGTTTKPRTSETTQTELNSYRRPGEYHVLIRVASSYCGSTAEEPFDSGNVHLTATIVVGPGVTRSNGLVAPKIWNARQVRTPLSPRAPNEVHLGFGVSDQDGFLSGVTVHWGDGTTETKQRQLADCWEPGPGEDWPEPSSDSFTLQHTYSSSGDFEVVLTATSSGCEGKDRQSVRKRLTVTAAT